MFSYSFQYEKMETCLRDDLFLQLHQNSGASSNKKAREAAFKAMKNEWRLLNLPDAGDQEFDIFWNNTTRQALNTKRIPRPGI
jgi:hypothetical protein